MVWFCETRTSTCRSFATISSGLYRFLAIAVLLDVKDIPQVGPLQWGRINGLRCFMIELRETEVDALIRKGLLAAENRHDYDSVQSAFYAFLDRALGELGDA